MRNATYFLIMFFIGLVACNDANVSPKGPAGPSGITAKIDNEDWVSTQFSAIVEDGFLTIIASSGETSLEIGVKELAEKHFSIEHPEDENYAIYHSGGYYFESGNAGASGEIQIVSINTRQKRISGTFSFTLFNSSLDKYIEIKDGNFNLTYTIIGEPNGNPGPNPNPGTNALSANVDGKNYQPHQIYVQTNEEKINIGGIYNNELFLTLMISRNIPLGNNSFDHTSSDIICTYQIFSTNTHYISESGKMNITKHDVAKKRIEGTFSFTGKNFDPNKNDKVVITNGVFAASYE
jgi:hypothetical protein